MPLPYNPNEGYAMVEQGDGLTDNLVGPSAGETLQATSATAMMQVVAPATLPEGYEFEAAFGTRTIKVVVPPGGVEEGQTFSVPLPETAGSMISGSVNIPVGHWRDALFDIFHYGICHPHCWTSCCCPLLAAGQVIHRMKLTWNGTDGNTSQTTGAIQTIFFVVISYWAIHLSLSFALGFFEEDEAPFVIIDNLDNLLHLCFFLLTFYVLRRARRTVREKYGIPASGREDACCSLFCPCFVSAQMLRHTTDYDTYPATCCTETGLPAHAPSIV